MLIYGASDGERPCVVAAIDNADIVTLNNGVMFEQDLVPIGIDLIIRVVRKEHLARYSENDPETIRPLI